MRFRKFFILGLLFLSAFFKAQHQDNPHVVTPHVSPALRFTENQGQWEEKILFRSTLWGGALYVEKNALTFSFFDQKKLSLIHQAGINKGQVTDLTIKRHAYQVRFENANPEPHVEKQQMGSDYENFYLGNDQSRWRGNVHNYHQIFLRSIYPGIDYELITAVKGMKYNFHIRAGSEPSQIRMKYDGVDKMYLKDGALYVKLQVNEVKEQRPYAYQRINGEIKEVACSYKLENNVLGFIFPKGYDKKYDLVIDPILVFAAQSGSTADNFGMTATYDAQGNLYAGGTCFDTGYPVSMGAFSTSFNGTPTAGISDVVITKYNSTGNALLFSTYIGGSQAEIVTSLVVDHSNNLCFYGATGSSNFPMLSNSFDASFNGGTGLSFIFNGTSFNFGTDIYLAKFNASGTSLLASTFLGGSGNDGVNHVNHLTVLQFPSFSVLEYLTDSLQFNYGDQYRGEIQVDVANNIYIASSTRSSNFPIVNGFDNSLGGKQDAVVCKLNSSLSQLIYSTYLGGSSNEAGNALVVKDNMEVYVTGGTCSPDFSTTNGAFDQTYNGGSADAFVSHISANGSVLLQSTFLGTSNYDQSYFVQDDKYGNIYLYGQSLGNISVLAASNATAVFSNPGRHQFITRFNSTLATRNLSTVFGSQTTNVDISPCAFAVDKCNNIYLSGWGGNIITQGAPLLSNMPLFQPTQGTTTGFDFYFLGLDSNAQAIKYGSYFGGSSSQEHVDGGTSRFDPAGRIYQSACAGCGGFDDWPVTPGAWPLQPGNPNNSSNCNNGVVKLDFQLQTALATIQTATMAGCAPFVATFTSATPPTGSGSTYVWYLAPGQTTSTNPNPTITYTAPGVYTVALVVKDNLTCNKKDSAVTYITIYPKPTALISFTGAGCSNVISVQANSTGNLGTNPHFWNFAPITSTAAALSYTYPANGNYNLSYTVTDLNGCKDVKTQTLSVFSFSPGAVTSASLCAGKTATLNASGGTSYSWSPTSNLNGSTLAAPQVSPPISTSYSVVITNNTPGYNCTATLVTQVIVLPNPTANFSLNSSPCSNTVITNNFSSGNLGAVPFQWAFGNGSGPNTNVAPFYTYPGNGTFSVTLTVTDINGCQSALTNTIAIFNFTPGVVSSSSLCYGNTTTLVAQGGNSYSWTPAASLSSSLTGLTAANPTTTTIYTVQIENNTQGYTCARTLTTQILVRPTPTANFDFNINPCGGGVNFIDQSADEVATWSWTLTPTRTSTLQYPYNFYTAGGQYTITLTTTNIYGCPNTRTKDLGVPVPPPLRASGDSSICRGSSIQLAAEGGVSYDWSPPETLDFPALNNPIATPVVTTDYSVNITTSQVVNGNVCKFILTVKVKVDLLSTTPISGNANPAIVTVGDPSQLTYVGQAGALINWLPSGSTTPATGYTVLAYPMRPTTYTAVASRGACTEEVEVQVDAYTAGCATKDFFIPNTFTPNGDGNNDILYVRSLKTDELYFSVYNRWGELVFETTDATQGWDGRFKGREADSGVFGYYLRVKCANGGETFSKGNVTLIR